MQPHGVRRHLFSCREMSVNRRRSMPPPMTCGSETYRADRRRDPKRLTASLSGNLYKLRNRLLSGSYFPSPVRRVEIPKASGETRPLGIPTVADRIPGSRPALVLRRGQQCRGCQMSRAGELLERKQGLLDRMQKEPGAIERTEIEQALKVINEALNRLESEQLDAPVPHH